LCFPYRFCDGNATKLEGDCHCKNFQQKFVSVMLRFIGKVFAKYAANTAHMLGRCRPGVARQPLLFLCFVKETEAKERRPHQKQRHATAKKKLSSGRLMMFGFCPCF